MSASPVARQATNSQSIPRRVLYNDESQLPCDYSSTPGGTLYSTTPGGTRIVYERQFLMQLRNSPLARTPPKGLLSIPDSVLKNGVAKGSVTPPKHDGLLHPQAPKPNGTVVPSPSKDSVPDESLEQFEMDM